LTFLQTAYATNSIEYKFQLALARRILKVELLTANNYHVNGEKESLCLHQAWISGNRFAWIDTGASAGINKLY
jgi:hypothetical protein